MGFERPDRMDTPTHTEVLLETLENTGGQKECTEKTRCKPPCTRHSLHRSRGMESRKKSTNAPSPFKQDVAQTWNHYTVGICEVALRQRSTAGYGKPYVRWCGRARGEIPVAPSDHSSGWCLWITVGHRFLSVRKQVPGLHLGQARMPILHSSRLVLVDSCRTGWNACYTMRKDLQSSSFRQDLAHQFCGSG